MIASALALIAAVLATNPADDGDADTDPDANAPAPVRVIFDTDMGNDVDDLLALGVIHALQSRGACELLAVAVSKGHPLAAPLVDAVNHFYGRGDIPVGAVRGGATPEAGSFLALAEATDADGRLRYPRDLARGDDAPEAAALLRRVLAAQPDGSVVIVEVGFSTNLARLLESKPDDHSPLDGRALVARKVTLLSIMAGTFRPPVGDGEAPEAEYNIVVDLPAARAVATTWPTPIVYSGWEIGDAIRYPARSIEEDFAYVPHHPLAEAYVLAEPPPHEHPCWDLTSVLHGIDPDGGHFDLSPPGRVEIDDQGRTTFVEDPGGPHRYLIATPEQAARARETLASLASQPPDAP